MSDINELVNEDLHKVSGGTEGTGNPLGTFIGGTTVGNFTIKEDTDYYSLEDKIPVYYSFTMPGSFNMNNHVIQRSESTLKARVLLTMMNNQR